MSYQAESGFVPFADRLAPRLVHVGDALLQALADRLRNKLRKEDTVARLSGDDFPLTLGGALEPAGLAHRLCDELITHLCEPYPICNALIVAADDEMYPAKRSGKNRSAVVIAIGSRTGE